MDDHNHDKSRFVRAFYKTLPVLLLMVIVTAIYSVLFPLSEGERQFTWIILIFAALLYILSMQSRRRQLNEKHGGK